MSPGLAGVLQGLFKPIIVRHRAEIGTHSSVTEGSQVDPFFVGDQADSDVLKWLGGRRSRTSGVKQI